MALHARLWIKRNEQYELPAEPFALVELSMDNDGDSLSAFHCQIYSSVEVKFRLSQIVKRYDRCRSVPYVIVATIRATAEIDDYEILEDLPTVRNWKCMVNWPSVLNIVTETINARLTAKIAGYDGPFTQG